MLKRGTFGVEYFPKPTDSNVPSGYGWLFALVGLVALVSLGWTLVARWRAASSDEELAEENEPIAAEVAEATASAAAGKPPEVPAPTIRPVDFAKRPHALRSLLMRRDEAIKSRNLDLEISTIESIRALAGSPAADLDDAMARRLGALNLIRLFDRHHEQWVKSVTFKLADSPERIASEHGSTVESLNRLNGGNAAKFKRGQKVYVMNHPHFNLIVHKRARVADLFLDGRFFKRYDLAEAVRLRNGQYVADEGFRESSRQLDLHWRNADADELQMLLPKGTTVLVTDI